MQFEKVDLWLPERELVNYYIVLVYCITMIYCCYCSICQICFFGKTVGALHERFNGHGSHINKTTDDKFDLTDDNTLANRTKSVHSAKTRKDLRGVCCRVCK